MSTLDKTKKPTEAGQIVKYREPFPDEDPNQKYIVSEIHFDVEKPRAAIKPIGTNLTFPPKITALVNELELAKSDSHREN
jgi:hypothetical protein